MVLTSMPKRASVTGVSLANDREGVAMKRYTHATGTGWVITSDVCLGPDLLTTPVLDRVLPGALGCYVYPMDAVLHMTDRKATRVSDVADLLRDTTQTVDRYHVLRLNHLTVRESEEMPPEEEDESESEEEASEDDEEVEEEDDVETVEPEWNASDDEEGGTK